MPWILVVTTLAPTAVLCQALFSCVAHKLSFDSHPDTRGRCSTPLHLSTRAVASLVPVPGVGGSGLLHLWLVVVLAVFLATPASVPRCLRARAEAQGDIQHAIARSNAPSRPPPPR